jgi:hypothetical protein
VSGRNWRQWPIVENVLLRTVLYYLVFGTVAWYLRNWTPTSWGALGTNEFFSGLTGGGGAPIGAMTPDPSAPAERQATVIPAVSAMVTAFVTTLPLAWIYTLTRNRKGYQQSVVQTLIILPVTIAGIVVLVKYSVALAFSLGGIVAAVRFRTSLDDTKDAANIFVATGIGMAAAVAPPVAWVLSIVYNSVAVFLWVSDFGRMPAALEGKRAERAMERALATANRTGMFVAKLDEEVLDNLAPEQLEAIADRAWRRRKRAATELGDDARPLADYMLRVRCDDVDAARAGAEAQFGGLFTRWKYLGKTKESDGSKILEYSVAPMDSVTPGVIKEILRGVPGGVIQSVEMKQ